MPRATLHYAHSGETFELEVTDLRFELNQDVSFDGHRRWISPGATTTEVELRGYVIQRTAGLPNPVDPLEFERSYDFVGRLHDIARTSSTDSPPWLPITFEEAGEMASPRLASPITLKQLPKTRYELIQEASL